MGAIQKAAQSKAVEKQNGGFKGLLDHAWPRMAAVLPKHMSADRMYQLALSAYNQTPELAQCSPQSVLGCLMKCTALGLEPSAVDGLGRAYILPYFNKKTGTKEAQLIIGYKGMIDLARRSGQIVDISARAVHEGDFFEYEYGVHEDIKHIPSPDYDGTQPLTHVYMVAHFKDGGHYIDVMTKKEVDAVRARSKTSKFGPWVTDYEAMARKTVIRRAFPYMPVSTEVQADVLSDERTPVINDSAEGPLFEFMDDSPEPPANVDPETGEIQEESNE